MASVTLEAFLPEVLLESPGVPTPVALNAIRNACFDFCEGSLAVRETQASRPYTKGNATYQLTPVADSQIVGVIRVNVDEKQVVFPETLENVVAAKPSYATAEGIISTFIQPDFDTIQFVAVPQEDGYFIPTVAYAPTRTATTVDAKLFSRYLEVIKYGALWKLKEQAGQPWADPAGAQAKQAAFLMGVNEALLKANRGSSRAAVRVAPRRFA